MKLQPFNEKANCPKCGYDDINTWYCKYGKPLDDCWHKDFDYSKEHIHRACKRCHYEWFEKVKE